jgi:hypothetical protein
MYQVQRSVEEMKLILDLLKLLSRLSCDQMKGLYKSATSSFKYQGTILIPTKKITFVGAILHTTNHHHHFCQTFDLEVRYLTQYL